ncbi:MAG: sulfatase-like hydrolase/transferase [Planctomycetes bacterium]|nr:sulfatase-like hydrolase/transferase [Planctomycetota bacterium]MBI3847937.1 sulfatase-like hydrolase/transferase [Planctomycetota bacterium]
MASSQSQKRRPFVLVALLLLVAATWWAAHVSNTPTPKPELDVVLVTMDTTRPDYLGCYGGTKSKTPSIDRIAAAGMRFTDAETPVPLTLPSHATILTGTYPPFHGVRHNGMFRLPMSAQTLAESMRQDGYATGAVIGATTLESQFGLNQGFGNYDDDLTGGHEIADIKVRERRAEEVTRRALRWIGTLGGNDNDRRFFLWVHYFDPHADYNPPPPFSDEFAADLYAGEIAYMDREIGNLVDGIHRMRGENAKILWVLAADHGESLGEHGEATHGLFLYSSTVHVPLVISLPGRVAAGATSSAPVDLADVTPTILDLVGAPRPRTVQGRSLVPLLDGGDAPAAFDAGRRRYLESFYPYFGYGWAPLTSLRSGKWKIIDAPAPELYDLEVDPAEATNLAVTPDPSSNEAALWKELVAFREKLESDRPFALISGTPDPRVTDRIRALGYVTATPEERKRGEESLIPRDPKDLLGVWDDVRLAERYLDGGEVEAGMDAIRIALDKRPTSHYARHLLAAEYGKRREFDKSALEYRTILGRNPRDAAAEIGLAKAQIGLGQTTESMESLERASALAGERVLLRRAIGIAYAEVGASEQARAEFDRVLAKNPRDAKSLVGLATVLELTSDRRGAIQALERALLVEPAMREAAITLGRLFLEDNRPADAARKLERVATTGTPDATVLALLGGAQLRSSERERTMAAAHLKQALTLDPNCATAHFFLGELDAVQSRFPQAIDEYRRAIQLRGDTEAAACVALAHLLGWQAPANLRSAGEAVALASRAIELRPTDASGYLALAKAELARGNAAPAAAAAKRGLELHPAAPKPFQDVLDKAGGSTPDKR